MSKKAYGGIATELSPNGVAKSVTKLYGEVGGVARKVIKGYCEVGGVAHQFWPAMDTTVGTRTDLTPGGTYELNTCLPVMAMKFALEFIRKLQKPLLNNFGAYAFYQQKKGEILADFLNNLADNNIVYITNSAGYSSSAASFYISIYLGKAENLNREIANVYTNTTYGNTYATIVNSVTTQKRIDYTFDLLNLTITRSEALFTASFNRIGLEIGYSSESTAHNVRITNLGMTMYHIDLIARGDWYWSFDGSTGMYDQIDHLKAFARDGSESSAIGRNDWIKLPAFLWERGRTIKIKCERFDPYWEESYDTLAIEDYGDDFHYYDRTEYSSESGGKHYYKCYYKYYLGGDLIGTTISNSSQYTSGKRGFVIGQTTKPCRSNQYVEQKGKINWVDLYDSVEGEEVGDMKQFAPNLSYNINLYNDSIECTLGVTSNDAPPIMNRNLLYIGQFWMRGTQTYALASYRVTEVEVV